MTTPSQSGRRSATARLEALRREVEKTVRQATAPIVAPSAARARPAAMIRKASPWLLAAMRVAGVVALPFVLLVGGSVWFYSRAGWPTWLALTLGIVMTGLIVGWYVLWVSQRLSRRVRFRFVCTRVALPLVLAYCAYSLLYISRVNAKSAEVRQYYRSVHPLLRVAVSTATVFDRELVVTDMERVPSDYDRMGLPRYENSLHFKQDDGYVHAVDLRTLRRAEWRNLLMRSYFHLMGFRTLRHVGTADHLHVSLPLPNS